MLRHLAAGGQALPAGVGLLDPNAGRPPRQNQWSVGIQREITHDLAVEVLMSATAESGGRRPRLRISTPSTRYSAPRIQPRPPVTTLSPRHTPSIPALLSTAACRGQPAALAHIIWAPYPGSATTNTVAQSLRPFPQFGFIPVSGDPLGKTWYDSLQTKLTLRPTHGFVLTSTFSWQKSLEAGVDGNANTTVGGPTNASVNNVVLAAQQSKSISLYDQPLSVRRAGTYTVPKIEPAQESCLCVSGLADRNSLSYSGGLPIPVPASTTSIANQCSRARSTTVYRGTALPGSDLNCHCYDRRRRRY